MSFILQGTTPVSGGGTGSSSLALNNVLLGNGTSPLQVVAPGTTGNVLQSNGTTWQSAAASAGSSAVLASTTANGATSYNLFTSSFSNTYTQYSILYTITKTSNADSDTSQNRIRLIIDSSEVATNYVYTGEQVTYNQVSYNSYTYASSASGTTSLSSLSNGGDSQFNYVVIYGELTIYNARSNSQRIGGFHTAYGSYYAPAPYSYYQNYGWQNKSSYTTGVTGINLYTGTANVTVTATLYGVSRT
jgi:hypothetical protein